MRAAAPNLAKAVMLVVEGEKPRFIRRSFTPDSVEPIISIGVQAMNRNDKSSTDTVAAVVKWIAALALLLTAWSLRADESIVTPTMAGHWTGNARIIVSWCHQTNLPVEVDIHADGSVIATVGDARLLEGRFQPNRGWLGRLLNLASDYIITGRLDGAIVAAEGITRERVMIPLDFNGGVFKGRVLTNGLKFVEKDQWKDKMMFNAASLILTHLQ
jgi:hypothetical protein